MLVHKVKKKYQIERISEMFSLTEARDMSVWFSGQLDTLPAHMLQKCVNSVTRINFLLTRSVT